MKNIQVIVNTKERYCITDNFYTITVELSETKYGCQVDITYLRGERFLEKISHFDEDVDKMYTLFKESKINVYNELGLLPDISDKQDLEKYINSADYNPFILERVKSLNWW